MVPNTGTTAAIRVLLISPVEISRSSLRCLLLSRAGIDVVEAVSCRAALDAARMRPDLLLFDHGPESSADMELLPEVIEAGGNLPLLILAATRDTAAHCAFMRLRVTGLVLKTDPVENLFRAIERLHAHEVWFEPSVMAGILAHMGSHETHDPAMSSGSLTARETDVIKLVGEALSNRQIAQRLSISETTVRHHLNSVFGKLGVCSRLELMKYAYSSGLVASTVASLT